MIHATNIGRVMSLAAAVAVLISTPVLAGDPGRSGLDLNRDGKVDVAEAGSGTLLGKGRHYSVLDSNRDGRYSLEEVRATYPNLTPKEYADFDVNLDGRVTRDELRLTMDRPGGR